MQVKRYHDPAEFSGRVMPFLLEDETVNNWAVGYLSDVVKGIRKPDLGKLLMVAVEDESGRVAGTGVSTGEGLVISRMAADALSEMVIVLRGENIELPTVCGPRPMVCHFADEWGRLHGLATEARLKMKIMRTERVRAGQSVSGELRLVGVEGSHIVTPWVEQFGRELGMEIADVEDHVRQRIERKRLFVWCDPEPVSMAALAGPTPNGIRVNLVYTPPEFRKRGYARACVAALSQKMLDEGKRFVFLFVDAENPTTMKLYCDIGYGEICDWEDWRFVPAPAEGG